jgi:hypothetical protein
MSSLDLEEFFQSCENGKPIEGPIDRLNVIHWSSFGWIHVHNVALNDICQRLKVKELNFSYPEKHVDLDYYLGMLASHANSQVFRSGHYPREIRFMRTTIPAYEPWILLTRARSFTWCFVGRWEGEEISARIEEFFFELTKLGTFGQNFHLREIWFEVPEKTQLAHKGDNPSSVIIQRYLDRNWKILQNCQKAIMILLGLKKRKELNIDRNVLKLIVDAVWETRATYVWIK